MSFVTDDIWKSESRKLAIEGSGVANLAGIVERENSEDISSFESDSRLLDELSDTVFGGDKRHDHLNKKSKHQQTGDEGYIAETHLHDLNLSISLTFSNMLSTLDEVSNKLSRTGTSELSRIVLLSDKSSLGVDR